MNEFRSRPIVVVGPGPAGRALGEHWLADGRDVLFVARPHRAERLARDSRRVLPLAALEAGSASLPAGAVVVLALRSLDAARTLPLLRRTAPTDACLVVLDRNPATLAAARTAFGARAIGATLDASLVETPTGRLQERVSPRRFTLCAEGRLDLVDKRRLATLAAALGTPALPCEVLPGGTRRVDAFLQALLTECTALLTRVAPSVALAEPEHAAVHADLVEHLGRRAWRAGWRFDPAWDAEWRREVESGGWCAYPRVLHDLLLWRTLEVPAWLRAITADDPPAPTSVLGLAALAAATYHRDRAGRLGLGPEDPASAEPVRGAPSRNGSV